MKFTRTTGNDNVDTYGRWTSECGNFSVQRFSYQKIKGTHDHTSVKPYYNVYSIKNNQRRFASNLKTWREVVDKCEEFNETL